MPPRPVDFDIPSVQALLLSKEQGRKYLLSSILGSGMYGVVYTAVNVKGEKVAIKMSANLHPEEGITISSLREIATMGSILPHPNVLELLDFVVCPQACFMVTELCQTDLEKHVRKLQDSGACTMPSDDLHSFTHQLLSAISVMHEYGVMHRDLKPSNILLNGGGKTLKVADFGMSRVFGTVIPRDFTAGVTTYTYRAPEVFLGSIRSDDGLLQGTMYNHAVDMWAAGLVIIYMINLETVLNVPESVCLMKIFEVLGKPTEENWPGVTSYPNYVFDFTKPDSAYTPGTAERFILNPVDSRLKDLICRMVVLNPDKRIYACQAEPLARRLV